MIWRFRFKKNRLCAYSDIPLVVGYGEHIEAPEIKIN